MKSPESLKVELGPLTFENPFILASAPPTATGPMIRTAFAYGWSGAVTKTIKPDDIEIRDVSPRFGILRDSRNMPVGFENIELITRRDVTYWTEEIRKTKDEYPHKVLIASLMSDLRPESWQDLSRSLQDAGADALELNFSCPHGMPERGMGAAIGQHPDLVERITAWVKAVARVPVIVKLTPNTGDIAAAARAARAGGADALAAINTVQCLIGVDIETFDPLPSVRGYSTYGGYSGKAVKPIGLRAVAQIAAEADGLPVYGMGGVSSWENAVEYIAVGAGAVQICTAVMLGGYSIILPLIKGLDAYLRRRGFDSVARFRGAALPRLVAHGDLDRSGPLLAYEAQPERCTLCQRCILACSDGGSNAITVADNNLVIDADRCDGCSLCVFVCPCRVLELKERTS